MTINSSTRIAGPYTGNGSTTAFPFSFKVFTTADGHKKVITHMSKKTRGEVTRHILLSGKVVKTPAQLHEIVSQEFTCTLIEPIDQEPWVLEVFC